MIQLTDLRVVQPNEMEPGTFLLGGAHYDDPPMFVFAIGENRYWFELGGRRPFQTAGMANNLHPYLLSTQPRLLVNTNTTVSPTRSDIPPGSAVLIGEQAFVAVGLNHGTIYVGLDGQVRDEPRSYERLVAFATWRLVVPAFGHDEWQVIYSTDQDAASGQTD